MIVSDYIARYWYKGRFWEVDERDRVYVREQGKDVPLGYNHGRAWSECMFAATHESEK